jgi:hypothetical protein
MYSNSGVNPPAASVQLYLPFWAKKRSLVFDHSCPLARRLVG